jgi:tetraacyldisaccharide 4'-kinase
MRPPDFWFSPPGFWSALLAPAACAYDAVSRTRRALTTPYRAAVPVVCVGNLVAGGAGKTPTVLALAEMLTRRGLGVHLLTRGYGGRETGPLRVDPARHRAEDVGDEALLLTRTAPTWVGADRAAGARAAVAAGAQVLIMDDGFQNPGLAKDLSLIVVDGDSGLGNGRLLPAGPLREKPRAAFARAQGLLVMGAGDPVSNPLPCLRARLVPHAADVIRGRRVVAFAGIARPAKFFVSLRDAGADVVGEAPFPDHHRFRKSELDALRIRARDLGALLVTTEKDHVRLAADDRDGIAVLAVTLVWDDAAAVEAWLAPVLGRA